jgi:hypothetical protein
METGVGTSPLFMTSQENEASTFAMTTPWEDVAPAVWDTTSTWENVTSLENVTSANHKGGISTMDQIFVSVVAVASLLSIPSCIALIVMHIIWKDMRTTGRAMLVQLSIADLLTAVGNLMGIMWFLFK